MRKIWSDEAWEDYLYWQEQDKKTLKKINSLIFHAGGIMKSDVPDFGIELAKVPYFLYYRLCRMEVLF